MQKALLRTLAATLLFISGCQKENRDTGSENQPRLFSVYLTDNPAGLEKVNIDIHSAEIKVDETNGANEQQIAIMDHHQNNDSLGAAGGILWHGGMPVGDSDKYGKWLSLNFVPGIYDILKLRNGIDLLLGSTQVTGTVRKIRIAIGNNNHVIKEGVRYPLILVDDSVNHHIYVDVLKESRVHDDQGSSAVYLDFDLGRSIYESGGKYMLKPFLRTLPADRSLELEGYAFPADAAVILSVYDNADTASALPDDKGYFKIRGLKLGRYNVKYHSGNGTYKDTTTVFDITKNKVTLPPMTLKKR